MIRASRIQVAVLCAGTTAVLSACSASAMSSPTAAPKATTAPVTPVSPTPTLAPSPSVPPDSPVVTAPPSPTPAPTWGSFVSTRHGYSADVPPGWTSKEYMGEWVSLKDFGPGKEVPGEDVIALPDYSAFLIANAMDVPKGMTADAWMDAFDALVAEGGSSDCPLTSGTGTIAGEPARTGAQTCDGSVIVGHSLVRDGRGYYFTIRYPEGDAETKTILDRVVESIAFTGG